MKIDFRDHHLARVVQGALAVLPQPAVMVQPPEAPLHYPTLVQHYELTDLVTFEHLHRCAGKVLYRLRKLLGLYPFTETKR